MRKENKVLSFLTALILNVLGVILLFSVMGWVLYSFWRAIAETY